MDQEGLQMLIRQAKMGAPTEEISEAPTMDTTQLITLLKNAGISEEKIKTKLDEWANTPAGAAEEEATSHGEPYENFAQSVNLSLKRYLDAQDMKVGLKEHTVEDLKEAYKKSKAAIKENLVDDMPYGLLDGMTFTDGSPDYDYMGNAMNDGEVDWPEINDWHKDENGNVKPEATIKPEDFEISDLEADSEEY